jgi:hypothetical protein
LEVASARAEVVLQLALLLLRSFVGGTGEGEVPPLLWFQLLRDNKDFLTKEDEAISRDEKLN